MLEVAEAPPQVVPRTFVFTSLLYETVLGGALYFLARVVLAWADAAGSLLSLALALAVLWMMVRGFTKLMRYISPRKTIETMSFCLLETLKEIGEVRSPGARTEIMSDPDGSRILCGIAGATLHEKKIFSEAIREMLSTIDNPRYLLIKRNRLFFFTVSRYGQSYACPSVIGVRQENVDKLTRRLRQMSGSFAYIYTRSEKGRAALIKCRRHSYINRNEMFVSGKKIVRSKWE